MSCTGERKKKIGGVPSGSIYCKSLDFPWSFAAQLGQELALLPVLPVRLLGEGPAVLILRCVHLGELPCPVPGPRLSGSCLPREAPVPWRPALSQEERQHRRQPAVLSSSGVSSRSNYRGLTVCTGLDAPGLGVPGGWRVLAVRCPTRLRLSRGEYRIVGCVSPPHTHPAPWGLRCWDRAPKAAAPEGFRAQPPPSRAAT